MKENMVFSCRRCLEVKHISEFPFSKRSKVGHGYICQDCLEDNKIKLTEEEKIEEYKKLVELFYQDDLINHNMKILGENYRYSDEDMLLFFESRGYHKKWLKVIFGKEIIEEKEDI